MVKLECIMFLGLFKLFNCFNITRAKLKQTKTKLLQYKNVSKVIYESFSYLGD